jgi:hypothetical protein
MGVSLRIVRERAGSWAVHGLANRSIAYLPSLAASVDYARRECAAAPATIELMIDGFYAVVHQRDGWPRELVSRENAAPRHTVEKPDRGDYSPFRRWYGWMTGRRRD